MAYQPARHAAVSGLEFCAGEHAVTVARQFGALIRLKVMSTLAAGEEPVGPGISLPSRLSQVRMAWAARRQETPVQDAVGRPTSAEPEEGTAAAGRATLFQERSTEGADDAASVPEPGARSLSARRSTGVRPLTRSVNASPGDLESGARSSFFAPGPANGVRQEEDFATVHGYPPQDRWSHG
jgi:hypothetical protein